MICITCNRKQVEKALFYIIIFVLGECVPTDESCTSMKCTAGSSYISNVDQCPELKCVASDCEKCVSNQCTWTRLVTREGNVFHFQISWLLIAIFVLLYYTH